MSGAGFERLRGLTDVDLDALCAATEGAIADGGGFGWLEIPPREILERHWRETLATPRRELWVARVGGRVVGSAQLTHPSRSDEAGSFRGELTTLFVAPSARRRGVGAGLLAAVEAAARAAGLRQLDLDVRATQAAALALFEAARFVRWGTKPRYAWLGDRFVEGHFLSKEL